MLHKILTTFNPKSDISYLEKKLITTLAFFHILGLASVRFRVRDRVSCSGLCQCSFSYEKLYKIVRHRFIGVLA